MWIIYINASHPDAQKHGAINLLSDSDFLSAVACMGAYHSIIEGSADPQVHYVDVATETVMDKTALGAILSTTTFTADGVAEAVLSGLPLPFNVLVNNEVVTVSDGSLEVTAEETGTIRILCQSAKYFEERYTVYAI
ncbi:hypothetical protein [Kordiimonas pumila]|uniref:Uncharacterized protein n=1 Tax=Kordiimonas pumila TaxID=2161677 RepID=A0ABV7D3F6_9PROT|nr:hypothetical protein [Kordiimonas pumila]